MSLESRAKLPSVGGPPALRLVGGLFVLLLASTLLSALVSFVVRAAAERLPIVLDPRLVGAVVYASVAAVALAALAAAARRTGVLGVDLERHELVQLGGALGLVLLLGSYWLHGVVSLPAVPRDVIAPLLSASVAMGLPAIVYARTRRIELPLAVPDRKVAAGTALAAGVVAAGWLAVSAVTVDPSPVFPGEVFGAQVSAATIVWRAVYPGVLVGFGMGALYHGAVQTALREHAGPAGAVAAVSALIGGTLWATGEVLRGGDAVTTTATAAAVVVLSLVVALVAASAGRWLLGARSLDDAQTAVLAAATGVLFVGLPLVATTPIRGYPVEFVASVWGFGLAAAVAAVGYERSRSLWVPTLAFAVYLTLADWQFVALVA